MTTEIILSGIQPTGRLHVGNYLGALKNFVELQQKHQCFFFIADYHSLTESYDPRQKQRQVIDLAKDFLAAGVDPKRVTLFVQSHVPEHLELAWIFNCLTPISHLERMTQYKDKAARQRENINVGLFDYPVLQAADILLYHVTAVPVGQDQDQHLELTRQIARFFNNRYGRTFVEPKTIHTETPKIMSLLDPTKKMSKSLGENHCIFLDDEPDIIASKINRAVTDTGSGQNLGAQNLMALAKNFSAADTYQRLIEDQASGSLAYAVLKKTLAQDIASYFADFRTKKKKLTDNAVKKILAQGSKKASAVAGKTMADIKKKVGLHF